jgi:hypothetical protein
MFAGFCFNCVFVENITMKRILLIMVLINLCVNEVTSKEQFNDLSKKLQEMLRKTNNPIELNKL